MRSFIFGLAAVFICSPATAIVQNAQSQQPWLSNAEVYSIVLRFQSFYADTLIAETPRVWQLFTDDATFQTEGDVIQGRATIEANLMRVMAANFLLSPPRPSTECPSYHLEE